MKGVLNILVRTSFRPKQFKKCMESILAQTYKNIRVVVIADNYEESSHYILEQTKRFVPCGFLEPVVYMVDKKDLTDGTAFYNHYLNEAMQRISSNPEFSEGFISFLDDDDILNNNFVVENFFKRNPKSDIFYIVQFNRGTKVKPQNDIIELGKIGGSCVIVPTKLCTLSKFGLNRGGDFRYIDGLSKKIPHEFLKGLVFVSATKKGNKGKLEEK